MAKPTGSTCNIACDYCFYLEKEALYPNDKRSMDDATLEAYIQQHILAQPSDYVEFSWQGGEPTLLGISFFKRVVHLQEKYQSNKTITNTLQTNAMLLNDQWCKFFKKYDFLLGVSIDGPKELHDYYRKNRKAKGSFSQVMKGIQYLKKHRVEYNLLVTINNNNVQHPEDMYQFLRNLGSHHIQLIPIIERKSSENSHLKLLVSPENSHYSIQEWSVNANNYGQLLCVFFYQWIKHADIGRLYIQQFENSLAAWMTDGKDPSIICVFSETCGHSLALEKNGDLYQCDHFVHPDYLLGNIHKTSIKNMNNSLQARQFGKEKHTKLSEQCINCSYRFACHGGCPKHRFVIGNSTYNENYFCSAYQRYFNYITPVMNYLCDILEQNINIPDYIEQFGTQHLLQLLTSEN
ncbi:UNVERIFIED_CONTAM: hypothetical protein GTU68_041414 [Idotea baltica]|nr:hypothetical protein [Idotea baltica]